MDLTCKSFVNISELWMEDNSVQKKRRLRYDKNVVIQSDSEHLISKL